jgi:putative copper export protein
VSPAPPSGPVGPALPGAGPSGDGASGAAATATGAAPSPSPIPAATLRRAGLRRAAAVAAATGALAVALAVAWTALVVARWPDRSRVQGPVAHLDASLIRSLIADRVLSVLAWLENVATLLVVGGAMFRAFVTRPPAGGRGAPDRFLVGAAFAGIAACIATMPLRAMVLTGDGAAAADLDVVRVVVTSRFGDAACLRLLGLGLFALTLLHPPPGWERRIRVIRPEGTLLLFGSVSRRTAERAAYVVAALVVVASFTVVGHPQATEPRHLLVLSQAVHVVAASVWFGGVALLAVEIQQQRSRGTARASAETVARFSVLAGTCVGLVGLTGAVLASSQLTSLGALASTGYGRALAVKLSLVAVVVAMGAYNHFRLVPGVVGRDEARAWRRLAHTAAVESFVIAVGVLVATAAMTSGGF